MTKNKYRVEFTASARENKTGAELRHGDVVSCETWPTLSFKFVIIIDPNQVNKDEIDYDNNTIAQLTQGTNTHITMARIGSFRLIEKCAALDKAEPVIVSCVDPLDKLLGTTIGGRTGAACLEVYEETMRQDNGGAWRRRGGDPSGKRHYVAGSLTIDQTALAQQCWAAKLRKLRKEQAVRECLRVTVETDDDDVLIPVK